MDSEMQVFENEQFGKVRGMLINGEPWFAVVDVCKALNIANNRNVIARLDNEDKNTVYIMDGIRGNPNITVVNEPGLYSLVLNSRKEEAKEFKHWITHDVLPTMRKTGGYVNDDELFIESYLSNADESTKLMFKAQLKAIRDLNKKVGQQEQTIADQTKMIEAQNQTIADMEPKASYYDVVLSSKQAVPITIIAKDYGMTAQEMNNLLHKLGIQYLLHGTWLLYKQYQGYGYTKTYTHTFKAKDGSVGTHIHTCWTQKGRLFIYEKLKEQGILPVIEKNAA